MEFNHIAIKINQFLYAFTILAFTFDHLFPLGCAISH